MDIYDVTDRLLDMIAIRDKYIFENLTEKEIVFSQKATTCYYCHEIDDSTIKGHIITFPDGGHSTMSYCPNCGRKLLEEE